MRRDQLEHAIRTACQIIGRREVIVVGSQSILGTFCEDQLPTAATMSAEIDIFPIADDNDETARLADLIEGVAGELSPFGELHGFSIDGVDLETSALPEGWRSRLVKVQNPNTAAPGGNPQYTGWCLDEDLCAAKLCAFREKDQNFVAALVQSALVDRQTILTRLATVDERYRRGVPMGAVTGPSATPSDETRLHGMQKVRGSNPLSSTKFFGYKFDYRLWHIPEIAAFRDTACVTLPAWQGRAPGTGRAASSVSPGSSRATGTASASRRGS